jgi:hypothetical protein
LGVFMGAFLHIFLVYFIHICIYMICITKWRNFDRFFGCNQLPAGRGVDENLFIVGTSPPKSLQIFIYTLWYMVNVSYIAAKE